MTIQEKTLQLLNSPSRAYLHPKIKDFLSQHKVFISLTTSPNRIEHLSEVFKTLDLRNVEKILLAIPKIYNRTNKNYNIPNHLLVEFPKLKILHIKNDLGPITKLLPAVEYAKKLDSQAIVITIDDDMTYPFGMVNEMIHYLILSNSIVGGVTHNIGMGVTRKINKNSYPWNLSRTSSIKYFFNTNFFWHMLGLKKRQFIAGFGGAAYRVDWLDTNKLLTLSQLKKDCFRSDDMVISYVINASKIPIARIASNNFNLNLMISLDYGNQQDALHRIDINEEKYFSCYQAMMDYDKLTIK